MAWENELQTVGFVEAHLRDYAEGADLSNLRKTAAELSATREELAGSFLTRGARPPPLRSQPVGYIEGWFVLPEFRKRGIGGR